MPLPSEAEERLVEKLIGLVTFAPNLAKTWNPRFQLAGRDGYALKIQLLITAPDSKGSGAVTVVSYHSIPADLFLSNQGTHGLHFLRDALMGAVRHEVDEGFLINNAPNPLWDPHANTRHKIPLVVLDNSVPI